MVLGEYTDSEESGDKDSQSSQVNNLTLNPQRFLVILHFLKEYVGKKTLFPPINCSSSFRYSLTEDGLVLAERLESVERVKQASTEVMRAKNKGEDEEDSPRVVDLTGSDDEDEAQKSSAADRLTNKGENSQGSSGKPTADCLLPGTYEILLCVDVIETTG